MRPTIPLADWKLAVNLQQTEAVQRSKDAPAFQCSCEQCSMWRRHLEQLLPAQVLGQLRRLKIDVRHPFDVYEYGRSDQGVQLRVIFTAVGKILSGPASSVAGPDGSGMNYVALCNDPFVGLRVVTGSDAHNVPSLPPVLEKNHLIEIDFRLHVPAKILNSEQCEASTALS